MRALEIDLPMGPEYLPGDTADVYVDGERIGNAVDLTPGQNVHPGHYCGQRYALAHYGSRDLVGHYEGRRYRDPHYQPRRYGTHETDALYHGLHSAAVRTFDAVRNELAGEPPTQLVSINTGPTPPRGIDYESQEGGGGAIRFSFRESPELVA